LPRFFAFVFLPFIFLLFICFFLRKILNLFVYQRIICQSLIVGLVVRYCHVAVKVLSFDPGGRGLLKVGVQRHLCFTLIKIIFGSLHHLGRDSTADQAVLRIEARPRLQSSSSLILRPLLNNEAVLRECVRHLSAPWPHQNVCRLLEVGLLCHLHDLVGRKYIVFVKTVHPVGRLVLLPVVGSQAPLHFNLSFLIVSLCDRFHDEVVLC
jgi:hypothetical protein